MTPLITEPSFYNHSFDNSGNRNYEHFSFKVIQQNGKPVSKHYSCQDSVTRLLFETCPDDTEYRPDILVVSLVSPAKIVLERSCFDGSCTFEQVLACVRESQSSTPNSHVILSLHSQKYQIRIYFNSFVRSFLGLPFKSMTFYLQNEQDSIGLFLQRIRQQLGLSPDDSRFWLFAKYNSLDKVHQIPEYESVLGISQDQETFFQFQFTDEAAASLMATIKCGYLFIKRKKMFSVIERKWCVLSRDTLTYCHSPGEKIIKQLRGLEKARIFMLDEPKQVEEGLLYGISILISVPSKILNKKGKSWFSTLFGKKRLKFSLYSFSREEIMEWRDALEEAQNPTKQNSLIREVELGTPLAITRPVETPKTIFYEKDDYTDIESIYSLFDTQLDDQICQADMNDPTTELEECFVCNGICVNPIKLEGNYPIHSECFVCHKCNELPIDYIIVSDDDLVGSKAKSGNSKTFVVCSRCYQQHYSPVCAICMKNITSGSLERKDKLFHATCYFSKTTDFGQNFAI